MRWIIGFDKDIAGDIIQLQKRSEFIKNVTSAEVSAWKYIQVDGQDKFLYCVSNDGEDGTFITTHINDILFLCSLSEVQKGKFIIVNTCILEKMNDKKLLRIMMKINTKIELFIAKQELSIDRNRIFKQTNTINHIGKFGFQTSLSERQLFKNRKKGLLTAIRESFKRVSPILLLSDLP